MQKNIHTDENEKIPKIFQFICSMVHCGTFDVGKLIQFNVYNCHVEVSVCLSVADEPDDLECAVHLVPVQQGSDCTVLVRNTVQGLSRAVF